MEKGFLKPDTFHGERLLGQPPGVNVILVMYSRFHNHVAEMLLKINGMSCHFTVRSYQVDYADIIPYDGIEGGRFTLGPGDSNEEKRAALRKQDEDLFQTARLQVEIIFSSYQ